MVDPAVSSGPPNQVRIMAGDGPVLVLFHGVTRRWQTFLPIIPALTSRWTVWGVDQRGHGSASHEPDDHRVAAYVADAVDLVDRIPAQRVALYGHSLGAMVALGVAARLPQRVAGVVLEDPPFHTMGERIGSTRLASYFQGLHRLLQRRPDFETLLRELPELTYIDPNSGNSTRLAELRDPAAIRFSAWCLTQADPRILQSVVAGRWLDGFDWQREADAVQAPRLVLQADPAAGGMLSDEDAIRLTAGATARSPAAAVRLGWPGVGHAIHEARPAELAARVLSFLETIRETC